MSSRLVYTERGHQYSLDGERVPSVTQCTGVLDKPGLTWWKQQQTAVWAASNPDQLTALGWDTFVKTAIGAADRVRDTASRIGQDLHAHAEKLATTGEAPDVPEADLAMVVQAADFLDAMEPEPLAAERAVFNDRFMYAGRLDLLAVIRGDVWLLDFKTSRSGVYPEMALQQSAYRFATHMQSANGQDDEAMPPVARVGIVWVRPDQWQLVPVVADRDEWRAFLATIDVLHFTRRRREEIVMAPLAAGKADPDD